MDVDQDGGAPLDGVDALDDGGARLYRQTEVEWGGGLR